MLEWVRLAIAGLTALLWVGTALYAARACRRIPALEEVEPVEPEPWPRLSVVVPACQEGDTLEAALGTLLAQDYPALEIVLVDDRSTDATGEVVDRLAARDPRVRPIHLAELPAGWLGKVNALSRGTEAATGEWVLYTDADVHHGPGVLRKAVALALARRLDHLTVAPRLVTSSVAQELTTAAFALMWVATLRVDAVADPASDAYVGLGAFNLVRRAALDRSEGWPYLRMEIADDAGLGLVLKRSGARSSLWLGPRDLAITWYPSFRAMVRGLEKNVFAALGHYRVGRLVARVLLLLLAVVGPWAALGVPHGWLPPLAACLSLVVPALVVPARLGMRARAVLLLPVGGLLLGFVLLRSAVVCTWRGGVEWRGTFYPLQDLRTLQRVKL